MSPDSHISWGDGGCSDHQPQKQWIEPGGTERTEASFSKHGQSGNGLPFSHLESKEKLRRVPTLFGKNCVSHRVIYSQVESDWILNMCFRPADPVLVCLLNNVISAQRENIDAAASSHCSSVRF